MSLHDKPIWIFGYGSLIWRPNFPAIDSIPGYIKDFSRRFYQGSTDHRGVPGAPGRVVTLLPEAGAITWGVAYAIDPQQAPAILAQLDHREKGGYERHQLLVHPRRVPAFEALVYMATEDNPDYLGPAPLEEIAQTIIAAHGPSGANLEYLLKLHEALSRLDAPDPHIEALVRLIRSGQLTS